MPLLGIGERLGRLGHAVRVQHLIEVAVAELRVDQPAQPVLRNRKLCRQRSDAQARFLIDAPGHRGGERGVVEIERGIDVIGNRLAGEGCRHTAHRAPEPHDECGLQHQQHGRVTLRDVEHQDVVVRDHHSGEQRLGDDVEAEHRGHQHAQEAAHLHQIGAPVLHRPIQREPDEHGLQQCRQSFEDQIQSEIRVGVGNPGALRTRGDAEQIRHQVFECGLEYEQRRQNAWKACARFLKQKEAQVHEHARGGVHHHLRNDQPRALQIELIRFGNPAAEDRALKRDERGRVQQCQRSQPRGQAARPRREQSAGEQQRREHRQAIDYEEDGVKAHCIASR